MKSVTVVFCLLAVLVASIVADEACECNPVAGCRDIGCTCVHEGAEYQPYLHPQQAVIAGCPACPPVRSCPSWLVRLACSENAPCSPEELATYVKVV